MEEIGAGVIPYGPQRARAGGKPEPEGSKHPLKMFSGKLDPEGSQSGSQEKREPQDQWGDSLSLKRWAKEGAFPEKPMIWGQSSAGRTLTSHSHPGFHPHLPIWFPQALPEVITEYKTRSNP